MNNTHTWPGSTWTVGFDSIFDRLEKLNTQQSGYPPHNVVKHEDDRFEIAIAVAGFNEKDLFVEQNENILTIASKDVDLNGNKEYLHKGQKVYDLIYSPSETELLRAAKELGCIVSNGIGMLLYQGAEAFTIWTGKKAPVKEMKEALFSALEKREQ